MTLSEPAGAGESKAWFVCLLEGADATYYAAVAPEELDPADSRIIARWA